MLNVVGYLAAVNNIRVWISVWVNNSVGFSTTSAATCEVKVLW